MPLEEVVPECCLRQPGVDVVPREQRLHAHDQHGCAVLDPALAGALVRVEDLADHAIEGIGDMLDHPAGAHPLDMVALRLGHQLIDAVAEKASLTDAVGADQIRGGDVALRQPPGELEGGSGSLDVSRDDAVPEHVDEGDDVLFDAGIQKAGQLRVGPQCGDVTVDQFADIGDQPGDPRFQAGCDRGDLLPDLRIALTTAPDTFPNSAA